MYNVTVIVLIVLNVAAIIANVVVYINGKRERGIDKGTRRGKPSTF